MASYPTYHSFYFKWSCLNLGSKSCGKYVESDKDKSDLEAAIKSVKTRMIFCSFKVSAVIKEIVNQYDTI